MTRWIYLDNSATTAPTPEVLEAVLASLREDYGNPSSLHGAGQAARRRVEEARDILAELLGCRPTEIIFTSGATESTNAALRGVVEALEPGRRRIVTTTVEHEASIEVCRHLEATGVRVARIGVDGDGRLDLAALDEALREPTGLLSIMLVNNETGVILPVAEAAERAHAAGALVHVDAVQAVGRLPLLVDGLGADLLSLSGHKFHGPKGTGVLYLRRGTRWRPILVGAPHEGGRRAGTENVPGIAGMGVAASRLRTGMEERRVRLAGLSERLRRGLARIPEVRFQGAQGLVMPGIVNVAFRGIEGSAVVLTAARSGVCLSAGSACSASQGGGSHVLEAMGVPFDFLHGAVRFSCSEFTTEDEVDAAVDTVAAAVAYLRRMDPGSRRAASSC